MKKGKWIVQVGLEMDGFETCHPYFVSLLKYLILFHTYPETRIGDIHPYYIIIFKISYISYPEVGTTKIFIFSISK